MEVKVDWENVYSSFTSVLRFVLVRTEGDVSVMASWKRWALKSFSNVGGRGVLGSSSRPFKPCWFFDGSCKASATVH